MLIRIGEELTISKNGNGFHEPVFYAEEGDAKALGV
jgi:hypothetical protein